MPELADVEGWRRYVARYARGRRVRSVRVTDAAVLRNTSPQGLGRALKGRTLGSPERRGKWLLVPAGRGALVLHFGMTGDLAWSRAPGAPGGADRVIFALQGGALRYRSRRKLGGVWWIGDRAGLAAVTGPLGPDAAAVDRETFRDRIGGGRGGIKAALMSQERLAGLGNELSDEILWHARIRPDVERAELSGRQLDGLYRAMRRVLRESMRHGRVPVHGRWLQSVRDEKEPRCPRCGADLEREAVAGRTALVCPACQPRREAA